MNILQEMAAESAMKAQLRPIFGDDTERAFQRFYEQQRKIQRETLRVLAQIRQQIA